jgi:hypothetical protein
VVRQPQGVRKIFQELCVKMSAKAYFLCSQFDNVINNLASFAAALLGKKKLESTVSGRKTNV